MGIRKVLHLHSPYEQVVPRMKAGEASRLIKNPRVFNGVFVEMTDGRVYVLREQQLEKLVSSQGIGRSYQVEYSGSRLSPGAGAFMSDLISKRKEGIKALSVQDCLSRLPDITVMEYIGTSREPKTTEHVRPEKLVIGEHQVPIFSEYLVYVVINLLYQAKMAPEEVKAITAERRSKIGTEELITWVTLADNLKVSIPINWPQDIKLVAAR